MGRLAAVAHPVERTAAAQRQYHRIRRPGRRRRRAGRVRHRQDSRPETESPPSESSLHLAPEPAETNENIDETEAADLEASEQLRQIQEMLADVEHEFCPAGSIGPEVELVFDDATHPFQEAFAHEEVIKDRYATASAATARRPARRRPSVAGSAARSLLGRDDRRGSRCRGPARKCSLPRRTWTKLKRRSLPMRQSDQGVDDITDAKPIPSIAAVHRREFGRLFAKLRQG